MTRPSRPSPWPAPPANVREVLAAITHRRADLRLLGVPPAQIERPAHGAVCRVARPERAA